MSEISACVLCYGDYPDLATRCLSSLRDYLCWGLVRDVRIGLNDTSPATNDAVLQIARGFPVPTYLYRPERNVYKYPLMRRMFSASNGPALGQTVLWLDDDSYLKIEGTASRLLGRMRVEKAVMAGKVYAYTGRTEPRQTVGGPSRLQREWISRQSWYTGLEIPAKPMFITGGFWLLDASVVSRFDWPTPVLRHNGGDYMLGILLAQQRLKMINDDRGYAVNADEHGRHSQAKRRGETTPHPGSSALEKWQDDSQGFECHVERIPHEKKPHIWTFN